MYWHWNIYELLLIEKAKNKIACSDYYMVLNTYACGWKMTEVTFVFRQRNYGWFVYVFPVLSQFSLIRTYFYKLSKGKYSIWSPLPVKTCVHGRCLEGYSSSFMIPQPPLPLYYERCRGALGGLGRGSGLNLLECWYPKSLIFPHSSQASDKCLTGSTSPPLHLSTFALSIPG